jgi:hypothetical protein
VIDPLTEEILPFATAARRLPCLRKGRPVSPATLWRWASHGMRGIKLETCKVGGTTCTSAAAMRRFFAQLSGEADLQATTAPRIPTASDPASARAAAELEQLGI